MMLEPRNNSKLTNHQNERCHQFQTEKAKESSLLFIGDSIVEFFPLKKYLGYHLNLVNHGIAGISAHWLANHVPEVLGNQRPDKIFLLVGTNDIGMGYDVAVIAEKIEELIHNLQMEVVGCPTSILSVLPVNEAENYQTKVKIRRNQTIQTLNKHLQGLPAVEFIDLYKTLLDEQGQLAEPYTQEGLHLTQKGYQVLAQALKPYI
ncbi:SGNH/GDSL hydrolase family protein [Streptococcus dentasini]